jgi:hypothetical protein
LIFSHTVAGSPLGQWATHFNLSYYTIHRRLYVYNWTLEDALTKPPDGTKTHGHATGGKVSAEYRCWQAIKNRCLNPKVPQYPDYGGRGIKVCERWQESFENFLADVGYRPPGGSIDRIDPNGNYEPGNVKWSTAKEQNRNQRTTKLHEMDGRSLPLGGCALLPCEAARAHLRMALG